MRIHNAVSHETDCVMKGRAAEYVLAPVHIVGLHGPLGHPRDCGHDALARRFTNQPREPYKEPAEAGGKPNSETSGCFRTRRCYNQDYCTSLQI
jgi:hypothetical protein